MAENINSTVEALLGALESYASTKTILGEPMHLNGLTILPIAEMSVGIAAGTSNQDSKNNGTGGAGVKVNPAALLIIKNGVARVVNLKEKDAGSKLIEMVPEIVSRMSGKAPGTSIREKIDELK